jgi:hypothetical protein
MLHMQLTTILINIHNRNGNSSLVTMNLQKSEDDLQVQTNISNRNPSIVYKVVCGGAYMWRPAMRVKRKSDGINIFCKDINWNPGNLTYGRILYFHETSERDK